MITAVAILLAVVAEALVAYSAAELFAVGFNPPHAVHGLTFVVAGLAAFLFPRGVAIAGLSGRTAAIAFAVVTWLFVYAPVHVQFAGNLAIWDVRWILDFIRDPADAIEGAGAPVTGVLLLFLLWVRCTWRSSADVELDALPRSLAIPFGLATGILVLAATTDRTGEVARAVMAFYAIALLCLACSQLALSGATYGDVRAGGTTAVMLGGTAAVTFVAVLIFGPVYAIAVNVLEPVVTGPLARGIEFVLYILLAPPIWLLSHLFSWLIGDIDLAPQEPPPFEEGEPGEEAPSDDSTSTADLLWLGGRVLLVLAGVGGLGLVIVLLARLRRRSMNAPGSRPESESVGGFGGDLFGSLRSLFPRRSPHTSGLDGPAARLYLEVLEAAHERGLDRHEARTPREFAPELHAAFEDPVTDDITSAFLEERYADRPLDGTSAESLRRRWHERRPT